MATNSLELSDQISQQSESQEIGAKQNKEVLLYAFHHFRSNLHAVQAYTQFYNVHGIDIEKQAKINWQNLLARLKNPLEVSTEMQALLKTHRKENQALTGQEKLFLKRLLSGSWFLKHVTTKKAYKAIKRNNHTLLSLDKRKRLKQKITNGNTHFFEGNTDNIFFSFGPGDILTSRFLDEAEQVISADYPLLLESDSFGLKGLWSSGHLYAFLTEQEAVAIDILGAEYSVLYRKEIDKISGAEAYLKYCHYKTPDGIRTQTLKVEDEIFVHPNIDIAMILMAIEKIRMLGKDIWEKCMQADLATQQSLLQAFFHPGIFELHKPVEFRLQQTGSKVETRLPKTKLYFASEEEELLLIPVIKHILKGQREAVLKILYKKPSLINKRLRLGEQKFTLLAVAILSGHLLLVQDMLALKADLTAKSTIILLEEGQENIGQVSALFVPFILMNQNQRSNMFEAFLGITLGPLEDAEKTCDMMLKVLYDREHHKKRNDIVFKPYLDAQDLVAGVHFFRKNPQVFVKLIAWLKHIKPHGTILSWAVLMRSPEVAAALLSKNLDVNGYFPISHAVSLQDFPPVEYTALIFAAYLNDPMMVEFLIKQGADKNLTVRHQHSTDGQTNFIKHDPEFGYTAIMIAVEYNNAACFDILLRQGANLGVRSKSGETVFSLAKKHKRMAFLHALSETISKNKPTLLHDAAKARDWEACEKLMSSGIDDLAMNEQGESAYDINPALLKQSFVPLVRQLESYAFLVHYTRVVIVGRHSLLSKFFVVQEKKKQLEFPVLNTEQRDSSAWHVTLNGYLGTCLRAQDVKIELLGRFSLGLPKDGTHYLENVLMVELNEKASHQILALADFNDQYKVLTSRDFATLKSGNIEGLAFDLIAQYPLQMMTACIISYFFLTEPFLMAENAEPVDAADTRAIVFQKLCLIYENWLRNQHNLSSAARRGDVDMMRWLLERPGCLINHPTPTLNYLNYKYKAVNQSIPPYDAYFVSETPLEAAIANKQLNAILFLLSNGAKLVKDFSPKIWDHLISAGQLCFFKQLYNMQLSSIVDHLEHHLLQAIRNKQSDLVYYIVQRLGAKLSSPDIFLHHAAAVLSYEMMQLFLPQASLPGKAQAFLAAIEAEKNSQQDVKKCEVIVGCLLPQLKELMQGAGFIAHMLRLKQQSQMGTTPCPHRQLLLSAASKSTQNPTGFAGQCTAAKGQAAVDIDKTEKGKNKIPALSFLKTSR